MAAFKKLFSRFIQSPWQVAVTLFAAAFLVYAPALSGDFIWDDGYLVGDNPFFKSPVFIFEVFRKYLFLDSFSLYYRPVQNLSYMVDYWLWNRNSFGYHVSNVCFHAASGFLLFLLLSRLFRQLLDDSGESSSRSRATALLVSLVWVIHPIHNAAVAYVSGRADSLASMFALAAWLLWLKAGSVKFTMQRTSLLAAAMFLTLVALCSKEIAFVWISLFIFYLAAFEQRVSWRAKGSIVVALACVLAAYLFLRHLPGTRMAPVGNPPSPLALRALLMLRALGDYTGLIFFPLKLHMERTVFQPGFYANQNLWAANIWFEYLSLIGATTLFSFAYMAWRSSPGQKLRILGAGWFMLGFLPISNLFPLNAQCAEHWIYMPSIGFMVFVAGCVLAMPVALQRYSVLILSVAIVPLGMRTYDRSDDWSSVEKFLTRTIRDGGGTCRIHVNLAAERIKQGDYETAEKILRDTMQRFPEYPPARITLGMVMMHNKKNEEAEKYLKYDKKEAETLALSFPNTWQAVLNLAHLREQDGHPKEALALLDDAMSRYPEVWELIRFRAALLRGLKGPADAAKLVETYTDKHWWNYDAQMVLARLKVSTGANDEALAAFRQAGRLDIHSVEPFSCIARLELALKKPALAYEDQCVAVRRDPDRPTQYVLLSAILDELGRKEESASVLQKAEALRSIALPPVADAADQKDLTPRL